MIFHPTIIGLYIASILVSLMVLYAAVHGIRIVANWDLSSGSEGQLVLERKTYLISTVLSHVFGFQLLSLFLFIFTADQIHTLIVGAMCAAGSLNANQYGYPTLFLKVVNFLAAGLWLIMNHTDNRSPDYPLIKKKYIFLLLITPLIIAETVLQGRYFQLLNVNIITSCCGSLFSADTGAISRDLTALPPETMKYAFYATMTATVAAGFNDYRRGEGGYAFPILCAAAFVVSILSILSFISPYFYNLPTHHCPFCILQKEYGYIGYPLYGFLFAGTILGCGAGLIRPYRNISSLRDTIPVIQKKLILASSCFLLAFTVIVTWRIVTADLVMGG